MLRRFLRSLFGPARSTASKNAATTADAQKALVAAILELRAVVDSGSAEQIAAAIDILASNADATKSVGIQVKTCQGSRPIWMLNAKAEIDLAENLYYVFVCLPVEGEPSFYVVPRATVAKYVRENHSQWLATLGRKGQQHAPSDMRKFRDAEGAYKNNWDVLGLSEVKK